MPSIHELCLEVYASSASITYSSSSIPTGLSRCSPYQLSTPTVSLRRTMGEIYSRSVRMNKTTTSDARSRARLLAAVSAVNLMMRDESSVSSTSTDNQSMDDVSTTTSRSTLSRVRSDSSVSTAATTSNYKIVNI